MLTCDTLLVICTFLLLTPAGPEALLDDDDLTGVDSENGANDARCCRDCAVVHS